MSNNKLLITDRCKKSHKNRKIIYSKSEKYLISAWKMGFKISPNNYEYYEPYSTNIISDYSFKLQKLNNVDNDKWKKYQYNKVINIKLQIRTYGKERSYCCYTENQYSVGYIPMLIRILNIYNKVIHTDNNQFPIVILNHNKKIKLSIGKQYFVYVDLKCSHDINHKCKEMPINPNCNPISDEKHLCCTGCLCVNQICRSHGPDCSTDCEHNNNKSTRCYCTICGEYILRIYPEINYISLVGNKINRITIPKYEIDYEIKN